MPLYTVITQDGTVSAETKAKIARDHPNPRHRDESAEELCPRGLPLLSEGVWIYRWRGSSYRRAQLCAAKRAYPGREDRHAAAALEDVSGTDRDRYGSARAFSSGNPIKQRHGDGPDHASRRTRIAAGFRFKITELILLVESNHVLFFSEY
jgi:hypothetical protein